MVINISDELMNNVITAYCDFTGAIYTRGITGQGTPFLEISTTEDTTTYWSKSELFIDALYNLTAIVENMEV